MVDHNKKPGYDEDKMKKYLLNFKKQISEKKLKKKNIHLSFHLQEL